jgi:hypothetical protein
MTHISRVGILWRVASKVRIEYPGGVHHVISRGGGRKAIFRNEADREPCLSRTGTKRAHKR